MQSGQRRRGSRTSDAAPPTATNSGMGFPRNKTDDQRRRVILLAFISLLLFSAAAIVLFRWSTGNDKPHKGSGRAANDKYYDDSPDCFTAPGKPGDRRKDKKHLKVANFNAEW